MRVEEVFQDFSWVGMGWGKLNQSLNDALLQGLISAIAHEHYQLSCQIYTILKSDFGRCFVLLHEIVYWFCVGFVIVDFVGGKSWRLGNLSNAWKQLSQRNNDSRAKNLLDVFDITIFRHEISNSQKSISFLRNDFKCLHNISTNMLTQIFLRQKLDFFDQNSSINFSLTVVDALLLP